MRRLKLHIPTNISFGTEMKFKIGRMIKYTDICRVVKMCIEFLGYPSYCLLVPKQCRLESRPVSLFQMSHLWMQSATWSHTCAVLSVEGTRCFFRAHFRRTSEIGRADMPSEVVCLCFGLGVYAFGNGPHSPRFVCDCDIESSRACYRSCSEWVSCRRYRSCQSAHNIPKFIILFPLCFYSPS